MDPVFSRTPVNPPNVPRDLQLRLYREIGIAAVAAALNVSSPAEAPATRDARRADQRRAA